VGAGVGKGLVRFSGLRGSLAAGLEGVAALAGDDAGGDAGAGAGRRTGTDFTNSEDISDSMASIFSAVAIAACVSRLASGVRVDGLLLPLALFLEDEDFPEDVPVRFGRTEASSSVVSSRRSFFPKSENIPTVSLRGVWLLHQCGGDEKILRGH
jgi:hypothetical protein